MNDPIIWKLLKQVLQMIFAFVIFAVGFIVIALTSIESKIDPINIESCEPQDSE